MAQVDSPAWTVVIPVKRTEIAKSRLAAAYPRHRQALARAFAVDTTARDHWLGHFRDALDAAGLTPEQDERFWAYITHAANFMLNTPG